MAPKVLPERDFWSGHPGDGTGTDGGWEALDIDELTEEELKELNETYGEGRQVWIYRDPDGARRRRRVPVFPMREAMYPNQYHQELEAPNASEEHPSPLTYGQRSEREKNALRKRVQRRFGFVGRRPVGYQVNEFPPMSSSEAELIRPESQNDRGYGSVGLVPALENLGSGTELQKFYRAEAIHRRGQPFLYRFVRDEDD